MSQRELCGLVAAGLLLAGCVSGGQQALRDGLLRADIGQKAFRTEWGEPDQTLPVLSSAALSERWGTQVDLLKVEADEPLELWVYDRHGTELLFQNGDLVAWKTRRTRDQLRAIPAAPR